MLTFNEFIVSSSSAKVAMIDRLTRAIPAATRTAMKLFEPVGRGVTAEGLGHSEYNDMDDIWVEAPASFVKWVRAKPGVKMKWGENARWMEKEEGSHSRVFFGENGLCKCTIENDVAMMAATIVENRIPDTSILDVCELDIGFYVIKENKVSTNIPEDFQVAAKYVGMVLNHIREGYVKQAELDAGDFASSLRGQLQKKQVPDGALGAFEIIMTALLTIYETTGRFILDISEPGQPTNLGEKGGRPVIYDVSVQKVFERARTARPPKIRQISVR